MCSAVLTRRMSRLNRLAAAAAAAATTAAAVAAAVVVALAAAGTAALADAKVQEKTKIQIGGAVGKVVNVFAGKAAREGVESTRALVGDRRLSRFADSGELVDLQAEKVYQINYDKKSYTVKTFAEIREEMRKQLEELKKEQEQAGKEPAAEKGPEYEVDVQVKETGKTDKIAGYDAREVVVTATVHEKGKKLDEAGGGVLTANMWLGPQLKPVDELTDFEMRYWKKLDLPGFADAQKAAAALAMYPGLQKAMKAFQESRVNLKGTPLRTVLTMDAVASPQQTAEAGKEPEPEPESSPTSIGGMLGRLGKKMAKKDPPKEGATGSAGGAAAANRATVFTSTTDILSVSDSATAAEVALPEGFKQKS